MDEVLAPLKSVTYNDSSEWKAALVSRVLEQESRFRRSTKRWNFWYYTSIYGTIACSALAALVLKWSVSFAYQTDTSAVLATMAAILGTASSAGKFEGRKTAARRARMEMENLVLDLQIPACDLSGIADAYKRVLERYECAVVSNDA
jgi:hypothetical protein